MVDGSNLGTPVTVDATGHATSPAISFPAGTSHTVNAFYVDPASNFVGSDTTLSPLTQIVLGPGVSVYGTTLYLVGGSTSSDTASVKPAGGKTDGSTGLAISATLNKVSVSKTFTQTFTAIVFAGYAGNETFTLASSLTLPATVTTGNGNDTIQLGGGSNIVALGDGNDSVSASGGNNTVTVGNGNDTIQLGDGSNVVVEGNGNDSVTAGNGNNLIVGGLGRHTIKVGNGTNILIDGSATVTHSGDSFRQILDDWVANPNGVEPGRHPAAVHGQLQRQVRQHADGRQRASTGSSTSPRRPRTRSRRTSSIDRPSAPAIPTPPPRGLLRPRGGAPMGFPSPGHWKVASKPVRRR